MGSALSLLVRLIIRAGRAIILWLLQANEPQELHTARFALASELRPLRHTLLSGEGVLLCQEARRHLFALTPTATKRELGNMLVVGPTRSGKGLLATSQLLSWGHSVIINDIKGDLFTQTAGYRSQLGRVVVLDPTGWGERYDPLHARAGEDALYSAAASLLATPHERDGLIFTQRAIGMLQAMWLGAKQRQVAPFPYVRTLLGLGVQETALQLQTISPQLATLFLDGPLAQVSFTDRFLQSAWGTLCAKLRPVLTATVVRTLAGADFHPADVLLSDRPVSVYIRLPEADLNSLAPFVRLLWESMIGELLTTYDQRGGAGCHPVLLLVDEAGRTAIPTLAQHATTVAGRGMTLWIAIQSLSSLTDVYGREAGQVIRDNADSQVFYRPTDLGTADYLQHRLGLVSGYAHSETLRDGEHAGEGKSEQGIPLLTSQQILRLADDEVLAFHRNLPPFKKQRVDWRTNATLRARHNLTPPVVRALPPLPDSRTNPAAAVETVYVA